MFKVIIIVIVLSGIWVSGTSNAGTDMAQILDAMPASIR